MDLLPILAIIFGILRFGFDFTLAALVYKTYRKYKYPTLKYLIYSISFLVFSDIFSFISGNPFTLRQFYLTIINLAVSLMCLIWMAFYLRIFIKSFSQTDLYNQSTISHIILISVLTTISISFAVVISLLTRNLSLEFGPLNSLRIRDLPNNIKLIAFIFIVVLMLQLLVITIEIFSILLLIHNKQKKIQNPSIKRALRRMKAGIILLFLTPMIIGLIQQPAFANPIILISFALIYFSYLKAGIFIFQDDSLRKFLIIDADGIPYYSYEFHAYQDGPDSENANVIFSGGLKAIANVFSTMTGLEQIPEEIVFEKTHLIIKPKIANGIQFWLVLFTNKSTPFYQDAISSIQEELFSQIPVIEKNRPLNTNQSIKVEKIIKTYFGFQN